MENYHRSSRETPQQPQCPATGSGTISCAIKADGQTITTGSACASRTIPRARSAKTRISGVGQHQQREVGNLLCRLSQVVQDETRG
jgi:hypothetical protein